MDRRQFEYLVSGLAIWSALPGSAQPAPMKKSRDDWRALLAADRYRVLFEEGTEPPFSSPLNAQKQDGTFVCAACHLPLFDSAHKFDSGTGWPSFWDSLPEAVATRPDHQLAMPRIEYHCARCGGHQGHLFDDGPPPTYRRYCNNGLALIFVPKGQPLPDPRT